MTGSAALRLRSVHNFYYPKHLYSFRLVPSALPWSDLMIRKLKERKAESVNSSFTRIYGTRLKRCSVASLSGVNWLARKHHLESTRRYLECRKCPLKMQACISVLPVPTMTRCKQPQDGKKRKVISLFQIDVENYFNVSSTNSEQSKLCVKVPLYIDARLLWKQTIGSNSP